MFFCFNKLFSQCVAQYIFRTKNVDFNVGGIEKNIFPDYNYDSIKDPNTGWLRSHVRYHMGSYRVSIGSQTKFFNGMKLFKHSIARMQL